MAKVVFSRVLLTACIRSSPLRDFHEVSATRPAFLLPRSSCSSFASRPAFLSTDRPRPQCSSVSPLLAKRGSRFALYGDYEDYVLIEPGKDETFVDLEELRSTLRKWLENWPGSSLPADLAKFDDLDDAVTYLVESACELEITDGSGTVQWFAVRL